MEQSERLHPAVVGEPVKFEQALSRHHGALVVADATGRAGT
jgi:hypothetical protein